MQITVDHIHKSFGQTTVLRDVSLDIVSGGLLALLGPSGSGKTTLLRIIAGIESPERGRILFGNDDVTNVPIRKRHVGFVFQHYALFETMTVADNIGFGMRMQKVPKEQIRRRIDELLELMQLSGYGHRFPGEISGGQRQRVALARALAPNPRVLLLDEPFGALDARVRADLRSWLRRLHDEIHVTSVFVTHDQEEAFEVADQVVIMNHGAIEQVGTSDEIFDHPATAFVLNFIGSVNVLPGHVSGDVGHFGSLRLPYKGPEIEHPIQAHVFIRRGDLALSNSSNGIPWVSVIIDDVRRIGAIVRVTVKEENGPPMVVELPHDEWSQLAVRPGDRVVANVRRSRIFAEGVRHAVSA